MSVDTEIRVQLTRDEIDVALTALAVYKKQNPNVHADQAFEKLNRALKPSPIAQQQRDYIAALRGLLDTLDRELYPCEVRGVALKECCDKTLPAAKELLMRIQACV